MKRFLILTFTALVIAGFVAFLPGTAKASGGPGNVLLGVATVSQDDAWAAGESVTSTGSQTLIEHLDDNVWQVVPNPQPAGTQFADLAAVAAISKHNVWSVGSFTTQGGTGQTLIEHWNGAQWQIVPNPNPQGTRGSFLTGIAAVSKQDVWAVGVNNASSGSIDTLIEQWNGHSWQIVPSPNGGQDNFLEAVTAVSEDDVWAVGNFLDSNNHDEALIEHWDGNNWNIIPSSAPVGSILLGVTAVSQNDVWAVGHFFDSNNNLQALIEHWNGQTWQVIASPSPLDNSLVAVTGVSHHDVWVVGSSSLGQGASTALTEHWNGQTWSIVSSPNPAGSFSSSLDAVAARSHKDVWAVGEGFFQNGSSTTLTEHWNGQTWSIVSSPTP